MATCLSGQAMLALLSRLVLRHTGLPDISGHDLALTESGKGCMQARHLSGDGGAEALPPGSRAVVKSKGRISSLYHNM